MRAVLGVVVLIGAIVGGLGYRLLETSLELDVYRERFDALERDFEGLRRQYDEAVRRTAVSELISQDGKLSVLVRTAAGELERIETPFDPSGEIYVDFVVVDGRIWIRRIFDANTPPATGLVIDPELAEIDWNRASDAQGKATYRALGEGRFVVTVSGDGSLGLEPRSGDVPVELTAAPEVKSYEPVGQVVDQRLRELQPAEVMRALGRRLSGAR